MTNNNPMTLGEAITRCNAELGLSENTRRSYNTAFQRFVEFLNVPADTPLSELTANDFIRFLSWLMSQDLCKGSRMAYKAGIAKFLYWLRTNEYMKISFEEKSRFEEACKNVSHKHESKLPESVSDEDMQKVLDAALKCVDEAPASGVYRPIPFRDLAIILLFDSSGLRVSELASLSVRDIEMNAYQIRITGKGSKDEYVKFDEAAKNAILNYWSVRGYANENDPAFARHDKRISDQRLPMTSDGVRRMTTRLSELSGVKIHPHAFRHHFGITILRKTGNLALTQDLMRHSSPVVTRLYATITNAERDKGYAEVFGK